MSKKQGEANISIMGLGKSHGQNQRPPKPLSCNSGKQATLKKERLLVSRELEAGEQILVMGKL